MIVAASLTGAVLCFVWVGDRALLRPGRRGLSTSFPTRRLEFDPVNN